MLHVDLFGLVAGKRHVEPQQSVARVRGQFCLVEELAGAALFAEEQPVPASRAGARRSSMKARNGASPVPGPTMIIGVDGSAGIAKCFC